MRNFVKMINEICDEENISFKSYSNGWVIVLSMNGVTGYIFGHNFGLNSGSVESICNDKCAASEVMKSAGISHVEHYLVLQPTEGDENGTWSYITDLLKIKGRLVCKPNNRSSGKMVFFINNQRDLEKAYFDIFNKERAMAVSPYYDIINEYRVIVLNGKIRMIYRKDRPYVIGDGVRSVGQLVLGNAYSGTDGFDIRLIDSCTLNEVPEHGSVFYLEQRHNLALGSYGQVVELNNFNNMFVYLVDRVVKEFNIRFAAIDIIEYEYGYKVLEINSGVMMEHFSQQNEECYNMAKEIYREAVLSMLE